MSYADNSELANNRTENCRPLRGLDVIHYSNPWGSAKALRPRLYAAARIRGLRMRQVTIQYSFFYE